MSDDEQDAPILGPDELVEMGERDVFEKIDRDRALNEYYDAPPPGSVRIDDESTLIPADEEPPIPADEEMIDEEKFPVENFLYEMESRLLRGESTIRIRAWARRTHGIDKKSFTRYLGIIRASWNLESSSMFTINQRRDESRQLYREIYREAMEAATQEEGDPKHLGIALKAVEAMDKLDGLTMPDMVVNVDASSQQTSDTREEITNKTRERTMRLLAEMQRRATMHAETTSKAIAEAAARRVPHAYAKNADGVIVESIDPLEAPSAMVLGSVK